MKLIHVSELLKNPHIRNLTLSELLEHIHSESPEFAEHLSALMKKEVADAFERGCEISDDDTYQSGYDDGYAAGIAEALDNG